MLDIVGNSGRNRANPSFRRVAQVVRMQSLPPALAETACPRPLLPPGGHAIQLAIRGRGPGHLRVQLGSVSVVLLTLAQFLFRPAPLDRHPRSLRDLTNEREFLDGPWARRRVIEVEQGYEAARLGDRQSPRLRSSIYEP